MAGKETNNTKSIINTLHQQMTKQVLLGMQCLHLDVKHNLFQMNSFQVDSVSRYRLVHPTNHSLIPGKRAIETSLLHNAYR